MGYSNMYSGRPLPDHSHYGGDSRQSQLAALAFPNVGMTTAIDTGDWNSIHPHDKKNVASSGSDPDLQDKVCY